MNFSEGSSEPKKYAQVIRVWGAAAPRVFELELLVTGFDSHLTGLDSCGNKVAGVSTVDGIVGILFDVKGGGGLSGISVSVAAADDGRV